MKVGGVSASTLAKRLALVTVVAVVAACGVSDTVPSESPVSAEPSPVPSGRSAPPPEADAAVAAFLQRMGDPGVTYRVDGELTIGEENSEGQPPARVWTAYDVSGDDFAGFVRLRGHALPEHAAGDYHAVVIDGTTHVWGTGGMEWISADSPGSARRANPFVDLDRADLEFLGRTDDGNLEFEVTPWIGGEPIGGWVDVGLIDGGSLATTSVQSHETRLVLDEDGFPIRLSGSWTFTSDEDGVTGDGSFVEEFSAFGLYVAATAPMPNGAPPEWSHDVVVGVDVDGDEHRFITEPFVEVLPPVGATAELTIAFGRPERPMMLGIEGAIAFLRSVTPGGELTMERIVSWEGEAVDVPSGAVTLVVAYRSCDGNCGLLDPPRDVCSVDAEIDRAARYRLFVQIESAEEAHCELGPAAGS